MHNNITLYSTCYLRKRIYLSYIRDKFSDSFCKLGAGEITIIVYPGRGVNVLRRSGSQTVCSVDTSESFFGNLQFI